MKKKSVRALSLFLALALIMSVMLVPSSNVFANAFGTPNYTYTVTYAPNGGSGSTRAYSATANAYHIIPSQGFTRTGYVFSGWNTRADGYGASYQNGSYIYVTGNITLYAQWKSGAAVPPRTVMYHPNGGSGTGRSYSVPINTYHTVPSQGYTRAGYTFAGYNTASNGSGTAYQVGSSLYASTDITLFAMWTTTPAPFTVTYYANGGTGSNVSYPTPSGTIHTVINPGFTRSGYTLAGFNTASNGTGTSYQAGNAILINTNVNLYAQWTVAPIPPRTVWYHPNGGSGAGTSYRVPINTDHTVFDQGFTRSGYTLVGWNRASNGTGTMYLNGDVINVATDMTLFAIWKLDQFIIGYNPNGGIGTDRAYVVDAYSNHTVFDQGFIRDGYTFVGWNTRADGTGNALNNGHIFWVYSDVTLYAQWSRNSQGFTVTYDPSGGTGGLVDTDILEGSDYIVKTPHEMNLYKPFQNFMVWSTSPYRSDPTATLYYPGEKLEMDKDYYLYAMWRSVE